MIEKKLPQRQRASLPVFLLEEEIMAVAGLGCDENFRPHEGEGALVIKIEQI